VVLSGPLIIVLPILTYRRDVRPPMIDLLCQHQKIG
jgi:hypothetical protein